MGGVTVSAGGYIEQGLRMFADALIKNLRTAQKVVVFTGAGVSAESGIATYRGAPVGLWGGDDQANLATLRGFIRDPERVWGWYEWRRMQILQAQPNLAHFTIAKLAGYYPAFSLITQNVDDLHERAGSTSVIHLHGSMHSPHCLACRRPHALPPEIPEEPDGGRRLVPPRCRRCGGLIRPGVIWFGENLPLDEWRAAQEAAQTCDLFLSIGTSSQVQPAAMLPFIAARRRACIVQINPEPTALSWVAQYNLVGKAGEILPALSSEVFGLEPAPRLSQSSDLRSKCT
jgi:NAD-dependent deacetylase